MLRLQESGWSKHLCSCLYFVGCFWFWHYPLNLELICCSQQTCPPFSFFVTVCQSFLISTFCTDSVFLHSKNFKFLHCLGLIDMLSTNQNAEIFVCILLDQKQQYFKPVLKPFSCWPKTGHRLGYAGIKLISLPQKRSSFCSLLSLKSCATEG